MTWRIRHSFMGWRFGIALGLLLTVIILILNVAITASVVSGYGMDQMGKASLTTGPCDTVKRYNTLYHLFINVLSTLLIGASNYTMQMLSAPTRSEIDRAHLKQKWLDIGVPSWRNLREINRARVALWIVLSISSVPLHLFFNSAVFVTLYQHSYHVAEIAPSFFQPTVLDAYDPSEANKAIASSPYSVTDLHQLATNGSLVRVDNKQCLQEVLVPMNTENQLYLLVTVGDPNKPYNTSDLQYKGFIDTMHRISANAGEDYEPGAWACSQLNLRRSDGSSELCWLRSSELTSQAGDWAPYDNRIAYCLNLRAKDQCALEFSIPIMVIICAMNLVKSVLFAFIALLFTESPIVTLGDAIASFIRYPSRNELKPIYERPGSVGATSTPKRQRRWEATTRRRWHFALLALCSAEGTVIFWLVYASIATGRHSDIFSVPFGTVDTRSIIYYWNVASTGVSGVIQNALIANIAQPILSAIYFAFNGLITAMCGASEWNSYSHEMKGLRVSGVPTGSQRSTHFLQLPYKYGVPLMVLSVLTHWMVSQAIFVVSVLNDGRLNLRGQAMDYPYYVTCGYSPNAIIGVIALGICMLLYTIAVGALPLKSRHMPLAGSNSMLIEQQCLLEEHKFGLEKKPLQWGTRPSQKVQNEWVDEFSDLPVIGGEAELIDYSRGLRPFQDGLDRQHVS